MKIAFINVIYFTMQLIQVLAPDSPVWSLMGALINWPAPLSPEKGYYYINEKRESIPYYMHGHLQTPLVKTVLSYLVISFLPVFKTLKLDLSMCGATDSLAISIIENARVGYIYIHTGTYIFIPLHWAMLRWMKSFNVQKSVCQSCHNYLDDLINNSE